MRDRADNPNVIAVDAEQSGDARALRDALDALEMLVHADSDAATERAGALAPAIEASQDAHLQRRLRLVLADIECLRGRTAHSAREFRATNRWAIETGDHYVAARSHRHLSTFFRLLGDAPLALEHAVQAVSELDDQQRPAIRADHLIALADALAGCGSPHDALDHYRHAATLGERAGEPAVVVRALNNLAYTAYETGDVERAQREADTLVEAALAIGPLGQEVIDTVARIQLSAGRYDDAERTLLPGLDPSFAGRTHGEYGVANCLLTLAEIQRNRGDHDSAAETLSRCAGICADQRFEELQARVHLEQAELYAAGGNYQAAYESFKAFHAAAMAQTSAERESRARLLHAWYETNEARRDSQRFRELAVRDPLTGLYNRRHVDEQLPELVNRSIELRTPLTVALIDLDHFKLVNDEFSHEIGDQVLREIARVFDAVAGEADGVAARMGGEEFLLVLPGVTKSTARRVLDDLCRRVRVHDWDTLAPGLLVTVSVGSASVPESTPDELLRDADRRLYGAKHAGRDRVVCTDPGQPSPAV